MIVNILFIQKYLRCNNIAHIIIMSIVQDTKTDISPYQKIIIRTEIRKRLKSWLRNKEVYVEYIEELSHQLSMFGKSIDLYLSKNEYVAIIQFNKYEFNDKHYLMLQEFITLYGVE